MRIVVNDIAASKTGALSVLKDFYEYIRREENGCIERNGRRERLEWIFLLSEPYLEETGNIKLRVLPEVKRSRKERLLFDLKTGGEYIMSLKPDIYFSLQNTLTRGVSAKTALYVHQPLCFQRVKSFSFFKKGEREYAVYQHIIGKLIYSSIKRADKTIVQTEWMRREILERLKVEPERVVRIAPDIKLSGNVLRSEKDRRDSRRKTFFYPSGAVLYKNHECLVKAVRLLRDKGITGFDVVLTVTEGELKGLCPGEIPGNIICRGPLLREEVFEYYSDSILVFPSYIESFGYPLAEASGMGAVVLASDTPFSREVLEGYDRAYYFDPFRPEELAALMEEVMQTGGNREVNRSENRTDRNESGWARVLSELVSL